MGVGPSKTTLPRRDTFLKQSASTQDIINKIFIWMINEVDIQDLLKLANPASCKEYVFVTKRALDTFFDTIQIEPTKGSSKDTLYFKPIKNATFSDDAAIKRDPQLQIAKEERDYHCTRLAFFIVRIFQVFGALALSVIDSIPDTQITGREYALARGQQPARFPLFGPQRGGARAVTEDDREFIPDGLYNAFSQYFFKPTTRLQPGESPEFYIIASSLLGQFPKSQEDTGVLYFYTGQTSATDKNLKYAVRKTLVFECTLQATGGTKPNPVTITVSNIEVLGIPQQSQNTFEIQLPYSPTGYKYNQMGFPEMLKTLFTALQYQENWSKSWSDILSEKLAAKPTTIQGAPGTTTTYQPYASTTYPGQPYRAEPRDESGTPTGLAWASIRDAIRQRPKAYCVARALQLLNPALIDGVRKDTLILSDVCLQDSQFVKDRSVPEVNKSITSVVGISALNNLFYDTLDKNVPVIGPNTRAKYTDFLKTMDLLFNPSPNPTPNLASLTQVINKAIQECDTLDKTRPRSVPIQFPKSKQAILPKVAMLLNRQLEHTSNVMNLLQQIFVIEKNGTIRGLQKNIQRGGLEAINAIAAKARDLLINYYQDCESMYRLGTLEVYKTDEFKAQTQQQQQQIRR